MKVIILKLEPTGQTDRFCVECGRVFRTTMLEDATKCPECRLREEFENFVKIKPPFFGGL